MPRSLPGLGSDAEFVQLWAGGFVSTLGFHVSTLEMQLTAAAINVGSLQQVLTPDHLLGRVGATQQLALSGVNPIGALVGGAIAAAIGLQLTLAIAAVGGGLTALVLLASPIRGLRTMPTAPASDAVPPNERVASIRGA